MSDPSVRNIDALRTSMVRIGSYSPSPAPPRPSPIAAPDVITRSDRPRRMSSPGHLRMVAVALVLSSGATGIPRAGNAVITVIGGPVGEPGADSDRGELRATCAP